VGSSGPVEVGGACDVLAEWDLRDDLDSAGAILFRRFATNLLGNFPSLPTGLQGAFAVGTQTLFTTQFDPGDPVNTPRGLNVANPLVGIALADAVDDLEDAGIPLDAGLRGYQYDVRGGKPIPIHGGPGGLGVFNAMSAQWNPGEGGYTKIPHGGSFIMAAGFRDSGCPVDMATFVTYGQSENQRSPHAADYTRAYSKKRWRPVPFCAREVKRKTLSRQRIAIPARPGRR
jgi:acyl-homoserine-lactone acylase